MLDEYDGRCVRKYTDGDEEDEGEVLPSKKINNTTSSCNTIFLRIAQTLSLFRTRAHTATVARRTTLSSSHRDNHRLSGHPPPKRTSPEAILLFLWRRHFHTSARGSFRPTPVPPS